MEGIKILTRAGEGYYEEKRSRFLALAVPANSEEEAQSLLAARRKEHSEARHHCYAYLIGPRHELTRFSDDGEPSGTGGRPILDILSGSEIHNCLLVVTRYFGGTLLGTGGLSRAYSAAAADALTHASSGLLYQGGLWEIGIRYNDYAKLERYLLREDIPRVSDSFTDTVRLQICLLPSQEELFTAALGDMTGGTGTMNKEEDVSFIREDNRVILSRRGDY